MPERGSAESLFWKALLVFAALGLIYLNMQLVLLAVVALVVAAAILPLADAGQKRRIPRIATVLGVYLVGLGVLALLVTMLVPVVAEQANMLVARLPQFRQTLNAWIVSVQTFLGRIGGPRHAFELPDIGPEQITPVLQALVERSVRATRGLLTGLVAGLMVLFLAGYIVVDRRRLAEGLVRFVPRARRERVSHIASEVLRRMGGYIRGQFIVSAIGALILWVGLALIGFEAPLLIGVLAGALNFVPYLGSTVSLILAILLALNGSLFTLLGVLIVFGVEQFLEGHFLVPYFTGRQVELHPLAVLVALIVGANLAGILGALVAVPVTAGIDAILLEAYVKPMEGKSLR
jgi:predicted PurR-regulated permease PerM